MKKSFIKIPIITLSALMLLGLTTLNVFAMWTRVKTHEIREEQASAYQDFLLELNSKKYSKELGAQARAASSNDFGIGKDLTITIHTPEWEKKYNPGFLDGGKL